MSSSNCCFLTCIQISQEAGQVVWYSHLFQNFPQFFVIHIIISSSIIITILSLISRGLLSNIFIRKHIGGSLWRKSTAYSYGEVETSPFKWRREASASPHTRDGVLDLLTSPEAWRHDIVFFLCLIVCLPRDRKQRLDLKKERRGLGLAPYHWSSVDSSMKESQKIHRMGAF